MGYRYYLTIPHIKKTKFCTTQLTRGYFTQKGSIEYVIAKIGIMTRLLDFSIIRNSIDEHSKNILKTFLERDHFYDTKRVVYEIKMVDMIKLFKELNELFYNQNWQFRKYFKKTEGPLDGFQYISDMLNVLIEHEYCSENVLLDVS